jgi:hypothetical protein
MSLRQQEDWFRKIEVGEIWGIGRRLAPKLHEIGIRTVLDLKTAPPSQLRARFSVVMEVKSMVLPVSNWKKSIHQKNRSSVPAPSESLYPI